MQKGNTLVIILVIVGILILGGVAAFFMTQSQNSSQTEDVMVEQTEEMMPAETTPTSATNGGMMEQDGVVTIEVGGQNFSFDPNEITVKQGDIVRIVFTSKAGMHDFVIDEYDVQTEQVQTGETSEVEFVADQAGEFEYYCSVGNHRQLGMVGTLIVE